MTVGADRREELLNGQVNQQNFKESGKLFKNEGCVVEKNRESNPEGEKYICRDLVRRPKNWKFLQQERQGVKGFEDRSNLDEESAFDKWILACLDCRMEVNCAPALNQWVLERFTNSEKAPLPAAGHCHFISVPLWKEHWEFVQLFRVVKGGVGSRNQVLQALSYLSDHIQHPEHKHTRRWQQLA